MVQLSGGRIWKLLGIYLGFLAIFILVTGVAFPVDERGELVLPDWYVTLGIILTWGLTWGYARWKCWPRAKLFWRVVGIFLWTFIVFMMVFSFIFPDYISKPDEAPTWTTFLQVVVPVLVARGYARREKARP